MSSEKTLYDETSGLQETALWIGRLFAMLSFFCIYDWANGKDTGKGYLGGLEEWSNSDNIWAYHPVLMSLGMLFMGGWGITAFRLPYLSKQTNKAIHGICHVAAVISYSLGLVAIWRSNDDEKGADGNYYANLNTPHGLVGLMCVIIYSMNFVLGLVTYGVQGFVPVDMKKKLMPFHVWLGTFALIAALIAILSGIIEINEGHGTCNYYDDVKLTSRDTNPAEHYNSQSAGCHVMQAAAVLAWLALACILFGIQRGFSNTDSNDNDGGKRLMADNNERSSSDVNMPPMK